MSAEPDKLSLPEPAPILDKFKPVPKWITGVKPAYTSDCIVRDNRNTGLRQCLSGNFKVSDKKGGVRFEGGNEILLHAKM